MNASPHTAEELLALLERTITDAPQFPFGEELTQDHLRWLGRAEAILQASDCVTDLVAFRLARVRPGLSRYDLAGLIGPLQNAYSHIELKVPLAKQGAFIPAGDTWQGYAAIVKLLQSATTQLLVVDPYINSDIYTVFAPHMAQNGQLSCLGTKRKEYDAGLCAAACKWESDTASENKLVQVRYANNLHDRLIIRDLSEVFLVSQSLKDIAKKSPASVSRAEPELAKMKIDHYNELWSNGEPLAGDIEA